MVRFSDKQRCNSEDSDSSLDTEAEVELLNTERKKRIGQGSSQRQKEGHRYSISPSRDQSSEPPKETAAQSVSKSVKTNLKSMWKGTKNMALQVKANGSKTAADQGEEHEEAKKYPSEKQLVTEGQGGRLPQRSSGKKSTTSTKQLFPEEQGERLPQRNSCIRSASMKHLEGQGEAMPHMSSAKKSAKQFSNEELVEVSLQQSSTKKVASARQSSPKPPERSQKSAGKQDLVLAEDLLHLSMKDDDNAQRPSLPAAQGNTGKSSTQQFGPSGFMKRSTGMSRTEPGPTEKLTHQPMPTMSGKKSNTKGRTSTGTRDISWSTSLITESEKDNFSLPSKSKKDAVPAGLIPNATMTTIMTDNIHRISSLQSLDISFVRLAEMKIEGLKQKASVEKKQEELIGDLMQHHISQEDLDETISSKLQDLKRLMSKAAGYAKTIYQLSDALKSPSMKFESASSLETEHEIIREELKHENDGKGLVFIPLKLQTSLALLESTKQLLQSIKEEEEQDILNPSQKAQSA